MKSLLIQNGDLVLGQGGFQSVRGEHKVRQDLSFALREPLGIDRFHPDWGSVLEEQIGHAIGPLTEALIRDEVTRIIKTYMVRQQYEMQRDRLLGRGSRFQANEVVEAIKGVVIAQSMDQFHVKITLGLASGESSVIVTSIGANTNA